MTIPCWSGSTASAEALKVFRDGTSMSKGTTTSTGLVHTYFANIFGPPQYRELHEQLAGQVLLRLLCQRHVRRPAAHAARHPGQGGRRSEGGGTAPPSPHCGRELKGDGGDLPAAHYPIAILPVSPLRIRMHSASSTTKILPSPMLPVRAPLTIASTVGFT